MAGVQKRRLRRSGTAVGGRLSSLPGLHGHPLKLQVPLAGTFIMIHHENLADNLNVSFSRITGENLGQCALTWHTAKLRAEGDVGG